jgi:hypothetical protein
MSLLVIRHSAIPALQDTAPSSPRVAGSISGRLQRAAQLPLPHSARELRQEDNAGFGTGPEGVWKMLLLFI